MQQKNGINVRLVSAEDRPDWLRLYRGYRDFYEMPHNPVVYDTVWEWLMDPVHEVRGLIVNCDGDAVGLAHFRTFARPIVGVHGVFLDDLFTDPARRGSGVASAALTQLAMIARDEGASVVRWITAEGNVTARKLYNRIAKQTPWVTYDLPPASGFQSGDVILDEDECDDLTQFPVSWCRNASRPAPGTSSKIEPGS